MSLKCMPLQGPEPDLVAAIVRDAGGEIVGWFRLQRTAYLLEVAGLGGGFWFVYRSGGPHSRHLDDSARIGTYLRKLKETEREADWGGKYSVFEVDDRPDESVPAARRELASQAAMASSPVLGLAATAVYLSREGCANPWAETERRMPGRAEDGRLDQAKELLRQLKRIDVPNPLPDIV